MVDILHRVGVNAPARTVYESLTTRDGIRAWWDGAATGDAGKGGVLTFFKSVDMNVIEAVPNELVKWKCVKGPPEWVDTEISFRLARKQDQTFVLFTHAGWAEPVEFMHHCSTKWGTFLLSLKALAESGKGRPTPNDVQIYVGG